MADSLCDAKVVPEKEIKTMKKRGGSISSCLSMSNSCESILNVKLLSINNSSQRSPKRKGSESSQYSSIDKSCENSFEICCRICHDNEEDEKLMTPCKCLGSIKYVHHGCLLSWISRSGELSCELCRYHFKVKRYKRKHLREWNFPAVGIQGWLHLILFFAFFAMLMTSVTWIIWSQTSSSSAAIFERGSAEIKYAYLLNGIFILTAVIGISLDSCRQAKKYFQRSLALNQEFSIEEFKDMTDVDDADISKEALIDCTSLALESEGNDSMGLSEASKADNSNHSSDSTVFIQIDLEKEKDISSEGQVEERNSVLGKNEKRLQNMVETYI